MEARKILALIAAVVMVCLPLCGCAGIPKPVHEPLTIMTGCRDYTVLEQALKEEYPEINLEFISYNGYNVTAYLQRLLEAGQIPDIYTTKILPDAVLQKEYLIDLSGYDFSARYAVSRLNECSVDGSIYMLPCNFSVLGIYYNKTLLEKYGWEVPTSFYEMEALVPKIRAAGLEVATTSLEYIGSAFQYLFNLGDTVFLRTPEGLDWMDGFLAGRVPADDAWADTIAYVQKWIDLGLIDGSWGSKPEKQAAEHFAEGNTVFFVHSGGFRYSQNEDGTGDRYGLMPWLSMDGSNNRYITSTACYFGLSAELELPRNKQKLADALKFMGFISTEKGQRLLSADSTQLLPLADSDALPDEEYKNIMEQLNAGFSAPLTYRGWEELIVPVGEECLQWYAGRSTGRNTIAAMERALQSSLQNETGAYATLPEDMTQEETAHLVGNAFAEAVNADCALISLGGYHDGKENRDGVNGRLFKGPVDDVIISTINPLGWVNTIKAVTLTGQEIRQLAREGVDLYGDGKPFSYVLAVVEGVRLERERQYTVAICGYNSEIMENGDLQDTGICGMDALRSYFAGLG